MCSVSERRKGRPDPSGKPDTYRWGVYRPYVHENVPRSTEPCFCMQRRPSPHSHFDYARRHIVLQTLYRGISVPLLLLFLIYPQSCVSPCCSCDASKPVSPHALEVLSPTFTQLKVPDLYSSSCVHKQNTKHLRRAGGSSQPSRCPEDCIGLSYDISPLLLWTMSPNFKRGRRALPNGCEHIPVSSIFLAMPPMMLSS